MARAHYCFSRISVRLITVTFFDFCEKNSNREERRIVEGIEWQYHMDSNKQTKKHTDTVENMTFKVDYSFQVCKIRVSVL